MKRILFCLFITLPLLSRQVVAQAKTPTVKVGVITPLSGLAAEYGTAIQRGIELAVSHYPELSQRVSFTYEDAEYSAAKAVQAFHKLVDIDRVDLVYVWGVAFCEVVAPLAETKRIPLVAQCISPRVAEGRSYVIRFMNSTPDYLATLIAEMKRRQWRKVGVVLSENPYIEDMFDTLKKQVGSDLTIDLLDRYQGTQNDFRSTVAKLRKANYDAVGVFLSAGQISRFYLQMRELRVTLPTFGTNFFDSYSEIQMASGAMEGAIFANNYVAPLFSAGYSTRFGDSSQIQWAALAYEFAHHLAHVIQTGATPILTAFKGSLTSTGAVGPGQIRQQGERGWSVDFPLVIKTVRASGTTQESPETSLVPISSTAKREL